MTSAESLRRLCEEGREGSYKIAVIGDYDYETYKTKIP